MKIFCDIDGTLFNNEHRAGHIPHDKAHTDNWRKFNELHIYDEPIRYRLQFLNLLASMPGVEVVYLTSRSGEFYDTTKSSLHLARAPRGDLHMRPANFHGTGAQFKVGKLRDLVSDGERFVLIDDDMAACHAVAEAYEHAVIIKVPSHDCAYLASAAVLEVVA